VLTGGPCGGKTSALNDFTKVLQERGYDVYTVPEVPTILFQGGCTYPGLKNKEQLWAFERHLVLLQMQLEDSFLGIAQSTGKPAVIIHDRALNDVGAYLPSEVWGDFLKSNSWTESNFLQRYDLVLHLVTAANGAEAFYGSATNATRKETAAEARELDEKIVRQWSKHTALKIIDNSTGFKDKVMRTTKFVLDMVGSGAKAPVGAAVAAAVAPKS